ncbi:hypothetical protein PoB_004895200 [Plakobranchus ocellatus]|uniref:Uncharacterized protein n=1 Tax=Plakobranchus ocellatus TaxID=259542 RepID=A0AAV4BSR6_9GAST|nr:hypothetical protein PoB_004895200 [Plakobranchus ocellatus]
MDSVESALRSAGTFLARVRPPPPAPWPNGGPESLRSACCGLCKRIVTATSVLQVSHDKSRRLQCGPTLTDTTLMYTPAPVLVALGFFTHGATKLPLPATQGPKIETHVYRSVITGGTTLYPKHNAGRRHRQNVYDHGRERALNIVGA